MAQTILQFLLRARFVCSFKFRVAPPYFQLFKAGADETRARNLRRDRTRKQEHRLSKIKLPMWPGNWLIIAQVSAVWNQQQSMAHCAASEFHITAHQCIAPRAVLVNEATPLSPTWRACSAKASARKLVAPGRGGQECRVRLKRFPQVA